jgi:VWFA-related protein
MVTDKKGDPVHGLKRADFTVVEDGKPQQVSGFEERGPEIHRAAPQSVPQLPANTYTNYVDGREPGAVNVILFDSLNTDRLLLAPARQQLLQYLSRAPENTRIALFTLDDQLHLVQGFTDDMHGLTAAAQELSTNPHRMMRKARDVTEELGEARMVGLNNNPRMYHSLQTFLWHEYESKAETRTQVTMDALNQLARSLSVFPGRKNLIWISGGLPFDPASTEPQMEKTAALLAATQIAVYPVDVRGVPFLGAQGSSPSWEVFGPRGGDYAGTSGQAGELSEVRETMFNLAHLTGGRAYYNNNDMPGQLDNIVNSGSRYYILAYRPENANWNGKFRKVEVKTSRADLKVQCRPGYYAVADPFGSPDVNRTFSLAMQPETPPSTALIFKAQVLPPEQMDKPAGIDLLVDLHDLTFVQAGGHHAVPDLMFVAAAWDSKGKPSGSVTGNFRQALDGHTMQSLMQHGLRFHQELQLKAGTYQVRLGVVDRLSGKIGTLDVPMKVDESVASK